MKKNNFYYFRMERLKEEFEEIRGKAASIEELAIVSLRAVRKCLVDFKEHSRYHDFETKAEEMLFFMVIKLELSSYRMFFMDLFCWWKDRPKEAGSDAEKAYWREKMKMMEAFFETHRQFAEYREKELMRFCAVMAAPENRSIFHQRDAPAGRDGNSNFDKRPYSNNDDEIEARLMAYARLSNFCSRQIVRLSRVNGSHADSQVVDVGKIGWGGEQIKEH
ncbi:MAG: RteC domain-containing protein [Bacteroidetes bacterium]|nr:RteC domain-containing protein [Bacteroidota bacterium]